MRNQNEAKSAIVSLTTNHAMSACKIPDEFRPLIIEIVSDHIQSLMGAIGKMELIYRRTLMHAEELRELEKGQTVHPLQEKGGK